MGKRGPNNGVVKRSRGLSRADGDGLVSGCFLLAVVAAAAMIFQPTMAKVAQEQWYYLIGREPRGPVPLAQIETMINAGSAPKNLLVSAIHKPGWRPVKEALRESVAGTDPAPIETAARSIPNFMGQSLRPQDLLERAGAALTAARLHLENEEWKRSDSFGRDELLAAARMFAVFAADLKSYCIFGHRKREATLGHFKPLLMKE